MVRSIDRIILIISLLLVGNCAKVSPNNEFCLKKDKESWNNILSQISSNRLSTSNSFIVIARVIECSDHISSINNAIKLAENEGKTINIILEEKFEKTVSDFKTLYNLNIPIYQDSTFLLINEKYVDETPLFLEFNSMQELNSCRKI